MEGLIRQSMSSMMQFGFKPGHGTTDMTCILS